MPPPPPKKKYIMWRRVAWHKYPVSQKPGNRDRNIAFKPKISGIRTPTFVCHDNHLAMGSGGGLWALVLCLFVRLSSLLGLISSDFRGSGKARDLWKLSQCLLDNLKCYEHSNFTGHKRHHCSPPQRPHPAQGSELSGPTNNSPHITRYRSHDPCRTMFGLASPTATVIPLPTPGRGCFSSRALQGRGYRISWGGLGVYTHIYIYIYIYIYTYMAHTSFHGQICSIFGIFCPVL